MLGEESLTEPSNYFWLQVGPLRAMLAMRAARRKAARATGRPREEILKHLDADGEPVSDLAKLANCCFEGKGVIRGAFAAMEDCA